MNKGIIKSVLLTAGTILCLSYLSVTASAATVDDVISHAREGGMPEEQIQNNISMYIGKDWTSEQCDRAIEELNKMGFTKPAAVNSEEVSKTEVKSKIPMSINDFKKLDSEKQAEIISGMLNTGKEFGYDFSIEDVSDDSITISTRDKNNKLVGVTILGNSIEKTGIAYTVPVLTAAAMILLSAAGMFIAIRKYGDEI